MRILALGDHNGQSSLLDSSTGEYHPASNLGFLVMQGEGGFLAGCNLYRDVSRLNEVFHDFPGWTIQIQGKERTLLRGTRRVVVGAFLPIYFGFVEENGKNGTKDKRARSGYRQKFKSRLFHCLDLNELCDLRSCTLSEALEYAKSITDLCEQRGVKPTANRGGLATRLLKASPEWGKERRAAPRFINEHSRKQLPGNYYGLGTVPRKLHRHGIYIDQVSSHHSCALDTPVPHPDHVRARGHHHTLRGVWLKGSAMWQFLGQDKGLVCGMISVGHIPNKQKHLYPPFMHTPGRRLGYFYTNETEYFDGKHGTLEWLVAAWTSPIADPVVPEYASWALSVRNGAPGRKPLLLAAYGSLAQRTDRPLTMYLPWRGEGMRTMLPGSGYMREFTRMPDRTKPQSTVINVIARGIIEAETRKRSLALALDLEAQGIRVLSVYVDGLILETTTLPILPPGWEVEAHLTDLMFQHPTHWTAREMSKQPGVPRKMREADHAKRMMQAAVGVEQSGRDAHRARVAERRERDSQRLLRAAAWRVRQGVV